jgi:hypothetical protein
MDLSSVGWVRADVEVRASHRLAFYVYAYSMAVKNKRIRKKRGRPATGQDPVVPVRLPKNHLSALDDWRTEQKPELTRSEAIRRLLEIALSHTKRREPSPDAAKMASKLASKTAEDLLDRSAPAEEQQRRKRRLIRGPSEFREMRKDQPKRQT